MAKAARPNPSADPVRKQAVIYARVSSKEQEKEGYSIPAQLKLLKEYAATQGFAVDGRITCPERIALSGPDCGEEFLMGSSAVVFGD